MSFVGTFLPGQMKSKSPVEYLPFWTTWHAFIVCCGVFHGENSDENCSYMFVRCPFWGILLLACTIAVHFSGLLYILRYNACLLPGVMSFDVIFICPVPGIRFIEYSSAYGNCTVKIQKQCRICTENMRKEKIFCTEGIQKLYKNNAEIIHKISRNYEFVVELCRE